MLLGLPRIKCTLKPRVRPHPHQVGRRRKPEAQARQRIEEARSASEGRRANDGRKPPRMATQVPPSFALQAFFLPVLGGDEDGLSSSPWSMTTPGLTSSSRRLAPAPRPMTGNPAMAAVLATQLLLGS